ncbi:hypothetical protein WMQ48_11145 [Vibrio cidicii]|uniref:general secretion pathway protein GspK n=1 Tax=Vibrio cidicii TaxID=1763883 RepID=UPI003752FD25
MMLRKKTSGAALIMVLMISTLMSLVVISMLRQNRFLVSEAAMLKDRQIALRYLENTRLDIVKLLTTTPVWLFGPNKEVKTRYNLPKNINFYGDPFPFAQAKVTIQDLSGLISLYPLDEKGVYTFLLSKEYDPAIASTVVDSLADWIDEDDFVRLNGAEKLFYNQVGMPRNGPIQTLDEVQLIRGITPEIWHDLKPYLAISSTGDVNQSFANSGLLSSFLSEYQREQTIKSREKYNKGEEAHEVNADLDSYSDYPSRRLRISISYEYNGITYRESFFLIRTRGARVPFKISGLVVGDYGQTID